MGEAVNCPRFVGGAWQVVTCTLPEEQTVSLFVNGDELVTILCTPEKMSCLVLGFLRSERLILGPKDIQMMRICLEESVAEVRLTGEVHLPTRRTITSGCGGGVAFDLGKGVRPVASTWEVTPQQILESMKWLSEIPSEAVRAGSFRRGMHVSALSDGHRLLARAEDIGRHNTLDKIWGECMLTGVDTADGLLVTTGRISSEMLLKAAKMGTPVVASLNSATQRAQQLGDELGITTVGYARGEQFSVYSHPERISGYSAHRSELEQRGDVFEVSEIGPSRSNATTFKGV
jgi:FdhD protein